MFHSPPSRAEVKNNGAIHLLLLICVHGVDRTLLFFFTFLGFRDSKLILKEKIHRILVKRFCLFIQGLLNDTANSSDILRRMTGRIIKDRLNVEGSSCGLT
jgi:hypothetical protein